MQGRQSLCTSWGHGAGWHSQRTAEDSSAWWRSNSGQSPGGRPTGLVLADFKQTLNPPGRHSPSRDSHLLAYYVLSRVINSLYTLTHLILTTNLGIIRCDHWWRKPRSGRGNAQGHMVIARPSPGPGAGCSRRWLPCWSTWPSLCLPQLFLWRVIGNNLELSLEVMRSDRSWDWKAYCSELEPSPHKRKPKFKQWIHKAISLSRTWHPLTPNTPQQRKVRICQGLRLIQYKWISSGTKNSFLTWSIRFPCGQMLLKPQANRLSFLTKSNSLMYFSLFFFSTSHEGQGTKRQLWNRQAVMENDP